jgi:DNA-binding transcriptional LysR family regulator
MSVDDDGAARPAGGAATRADPSIHQLRMFLVLVTERHFGRAATRLYISQSALSQQLRALEDRLGVRLVDRSSRTVELTPAGRAVLADVREVVAAADQLQRAVRRHVAGTTGELVIGTIGAEAAMPYTKAILAAVHREHPDLVIRMRNLNFVDHIRALVTGEVDVVFLRPPVPEGIQTLHLFTEARIVCVAADDALATRGRVSLADLAGHRVVDVPPEAPRAWWNFWVIDPRPDGSPVRYGPVVPDVEALLHAVAQRQAIAFLPAAARDLFPGRGVAFLDVDGAPPCTAALAWLARNRADPMVAMIHRIAATVVAASAGEYG